MSLRRLSLGLFALVAVAGCGQGSTSSSLNLQQVPLVPGAKIMSTSTQCDRGSNPFCAIEAVIVDPRFKSSGALVATEDRRLHQFGWKSSAGDDGDEVAADSPGQKLRVTFASAVGDLIGIDEKWITRSGEITTALDQTVLKRTPAMSIMLEQGPT
jgi:hypothetical protein